MDIVFNPCCGVYLEGRAISASSGILEIFCPVCGRAFRFGVHRDGGRYYVNDPDTVKKGAEKWNEGVI